MIALWSSVVVTAMMGLLWLSLPLALLGIYFEQR